MNAANTPKKKRKQPKGHGVRMMQGVVLPVQHPSNPNLYYVSFGDKTTNPDGRLESGIWCHNALGTFTSYRDIENNPISYGSYTPIQPYTPVTVLMSEEGAGQSIIIANAPTNTNTPDFENADKLHLLVETPKGTYIAADDKTGSIQLMYNQGASGIMIGENMISMEVMKGKNSGKTGDTAINISRGSIEMRLRDSTMKFDESGLNVSFDDGGSYVKITKSGVEIHGEGHTKITSKEEVSLKGSKTTIQGTKDASVNANHLKIGGKQLTSITGAQIGMEANISIGLKALYIGSEAGAMISHKAAEYNGEFGASAMFQTPIMAFKNSSFAVKSGSISLGSSAIYIDGNVVSNSGLGNSVSGSTTSSVASTNTALTNAFKSIGTTMLTKQAGISAANKTMADTLAGTSEPAQDPSGNAGGAKDKNDTNTYGSVASSKYARTRTVRHKFSTVPNLVYRSKTNLLMAKTYFGDVPLNPAGLNSVEDNLQAENENMYDWYNGNNDLNGGAIRNYNNPSTPPPAPTQTLQKIRQNSGKSKRSSSKTMKTFFKGK